MLGPGGAQLLERCESGAGYQRLPVAEIELDDEIEIDVRASLASSACAAWHVVSLVESESELLQTLSSVSSRITLDSAAWMLLHTPSGVNSHALLCNDGGRLVCTLDALACQPQEPLVHDCELPLSFYAGVEISGRALERDIAAG